MENRKNLVAVGPESQPDETTQAAEPAEFVLDEPYVEPDDDWSEDEPVRILGRFGWVIPTLAIIAILGWTGFFGWIHQREFLTGATPAQWADIVGDWAVPVLIVIALWLLALRNSRREAARFGAAAQMLSQESALLEWRLATVTRELSLAREFIAAQSRDLEHDRHAGLCRPGYRLARPKLR